MGMRVVYGWIVLRFCPRARKSVYVFMGLVNAVEDGSKVELEPFLSCEEHVSE